MNQSGGCTCCSVCKPAAGAPAGEDVVLEGVHEFVREHVLEALEVAGEGKEDAMPQRLRHTPRPLAQISGHVVLSEVGARPEEDDRLLLPELVVQHPRQAPVRPLGHACAIDDDVLFLGIVVHEEVLGLEHTPAELVVLHLVLAEVHLPFDPSQRDGRRDGNGHDPQTRVHAEAPCDLSGTMAASPHSRSS